MLPQKATKQVGLHRLAFGEHFANYWKEAIFKLPLKFNMLYCMKQSVHEICGLKHKS